VVGYILRKTKFQPTHSEILFRLFLIGMGSYLRNGKNGAKSCDMVQPMRAFFHSEDE